MKIFNKFIILLAFMLLGINSAKSVIYVDIDSGNIEPISIAIMDFGGETSDIKSLG